MLAALYARVWLRVPAARPLTARYGIGDALGAALWLASLALDEGTRPVVWALAMVVLMVTPYVAVVALPERAHDPRHIAERYGLFTIIVLGESVVVTVTGIDTASRAAAVLVALLGFVIAATVWWVYFDRWRAMPDRHHAGGFVWAQGHFLVFAGIAAAAVGIEFCVEAAAAGEALKPADRLPLGAGLAAYLVAMAMIRAATRLGRRGAGGRRPGHPRRGAARGGSRAARARCRDHGAVRRRGGHRAASRTKRMTSRVASGPTGCGREAGARRPASRGPCPTGADSRPASRRRSRGSVTRVTRGRGVLVRGRASQPSRRAQRAVLRGTLPARSGFLPLKGTTVSAVPWMARNEARADAGQGSSARKPAATGTTAANRPGSSHAMRVAKPAPLDTPVIEIRSASKQPLAAWRSSRPRDGIDVGAALPSLSVQKSSVEVG